MIVRRFNIVVDFLRKLCKEGFPNGNVFEYASQQMLKYDKKRKADIQRKATMKNSVDELHLSIQVK